MGKVVHLRTGAAGLALSTTWVERYGYKGGAQAGDIRRTNVLVPAHFQR
jgi:hypothetical protein